jgi:hypothetical protein
MKMLFALLAIQGASPGADPVLIDTAPVTTLDSISPFSAYWGALILSAGSTGELSFRVERNGAPQPLRPCPPVGEAILELAERIRPPAAIVFVQSLLPEGATLAWPETPYGQLLSEAEAEIVIDAAGHITQCRMISRTIYAEQSPEPPDICDRPRPPRYPRGAPGRRARVSAKIYLSNNVEG